MGTTVKIPKQKYNNLLNASNGNIPYDETEMAFFLNMLNEDLISSTSQSSVKTTELELELTLVFVLVTTNPTLE